jgi:hypothetical protein
MKPVTFCGRTFSVQEAELMREIAQDYAGLGVTEIARPYASCWSGGSTTTAEFLSEASLAWPSP